MFFLQTFPDQVVNLSEDNQYGVCVCVELDKYRHENCVGGHYVDVYKPSIRKLMDKRLSQALVTG